MAKGKEQINPDTVCSRSRDVIERFLQGEAVLLDLNSGLYFSLNSVGGFIWNHLDGKRSVQDIAGLLAQEYEVSPETALRDTGELLADLLDQNLAGAGAGES